MFRLLLCFLCSLALAVVAGAVRFAPGQVSMSPWLDAAFLVATAFTVVFVVRFLAVAFSRAFRRDLDSISTDDDDSGA